ncbi:hypothetical protein [Dongia sedimenti]|uniref:Uncharacterized protein n=1 Tax=Dongia sedimenti TaxID=3064282 RepID=A0ABU0YVN6_9PROT|nr:hypothetical protein [Rhodospirillaceae bacterium R-7]
MRRRKPAERFRPILKSSAIAVAASIDDVSDGSDFRFLLVRYPDGWVFTGTDDHRLDGKVETVTIERRHPDGIPSGRYLRVPIDPVVDPWGRVAIDIAFDTPDGVQHAELTIQTRDDTAAARDASDEGGPEAIHITGGSVLAQTAAAAVFFIEGNPGDVLDLSDDRSGRWIAGDSDGTHTLYMRHDTAGKRTATLAVRNGVAVSMK